MPGDKVPDQMMTPERLAWAQSLGLAQRLPVTNPEPIEAPQPEAPKSEIRKPERTLAIVGQEISGRETLVLQVPGGQVRFEGTQEGAMMKARTLAASESATFVVCQPLTLLAPKTVVNEEVVGEGPSPMLADVQSGRHGERRAPSR